MALSSCTVMCRLSDVGLNGVKPSRNHSLGRSIGLNGSNGPGIIKTGQLIAGNWCCGLMTQSLICLVRRGVSMFVDGELRSFIQTVSSLWLNTEVVMSWFGDVLVACRLETLSKLRGS